MPAIPVACRPLERQHFRAIENCLSGMDTARFLGLYVIGVDVVAMNSGWDLCVMGTEDRGLRDCVVDALGVTALGTGADSAVVMDRQEGLTSVALTGDAIGFLAGANPRPA